MNAKTVLILCLAVVCFAVAGMVVQAGTSGISNRILPKPVELDPYAPVPAPAPAVVSTPEREAVTEKAGLEAQRPANPEPSAEELERDAAWQAHARWQATGEASAYEKDLMDKWVFAHETVAGNPLDNIGGPDGFGYRFMDNVSPDTATYEWIELCGDPGATNGPVGDDVTALATIGFTFPIYGSTYTSCYVSTNGLIAFNTSITAYQASDPATVNPTYRYIAPFWVDQYDNSATNPLGGCTSNGISPWIRWKTVGTAPDQYFVVEWRRAPEYNTGNLFSYEAILYPDGKVKVQIHETDWTMPTYSPRTWAIGMDGPGTNYGVRYWYYSSPNHLGNIPAAGRVIWFYPSPPLPHNFGCMGVTSPSGGNYQPGAAVTVTFTAGNFGTTTEPSPVSYRFNGGAVITENTASLPQNGTEAHTFTATFSAPPAIGDYVLDVWTDLGTDQDHSNDTCHVTVRVRECADIVMTAPGTTNGSTIGAGNDCALRVGPEQIVQITIPNDGLWSFSMCNTASSWDSYMYLNTACCGGTTLASVDGGCPSGSLNLSKISCIQLTAGTYFIDIEPWSSSGTGGAWTLDVTECTPPPADFTMTAPGSVSGNTAGAGDDCWLRAGSDQIVQVTIPVDGMWSFSLCNSTPVWDSYIYLTTLPCAGTTVAYADGGCTGSSLSKINCQMLTAGTYYVDIEGSSSTYTGAWTLEVTQCIPPTPDFVINAPGSATGSTVGAGDDCWLRTGADQMVQVVIPYDGQWSFSLCNSASSWDTYIYLTSVACGGTTIATADGGCPGGSLNLSKISCRTLTAGTYYVDIEPYSSTNSGPWTLDVTECVPCVIEQQAGDVVEAVEDPADPNFYINDPDGGCNSSPAAFGSIDCGQTVYGRLFTYIPPSGTSRADSDWYAINAAVPESLVVDIISEVPVRFGIVKYGRVAPCDSALLWIVSSTTSDSCNHYIVRSPECRATGFYALVVVPTVSSGLTTPREYRLALNCFPCSPPMPPANDDCATATPITVAHNDSTVVTGSTSLANVTCPDTCDFTSYGKDVFYALNVTGCRLIQMRLSQTQDGTSGDMHISVYAPGECCSHPALLCNDDWGHFDSTGLTWAHRHGSYSLTSWVADTFLTGIYTIRVGRYTSGSGPYTLVVYDEGASCVEVCDSARNVTVYRVDAARPDSCVEVRFDAPLAGLYEIWTTADKNAPFEPGGVWTLETTLTAPLGVSAWRDPAALQVFRRYVVRHLCPTP